MATADTYDFQSLESTIVFVAYGSLAHEVDGDVASETVARRPLSQ